MVWVNIHISLGLAFPQGKKGKCIYLTKKAYTVVRIGGNFEGHISFEHAIPSAKVLSPVSIHKVRHLWTIELQNRDLDRKKVKAIFLVAHHEPREWQMENMNADNEENI